MRKCPRCHKMMSDNAYLIDQGHAVSDFVIVQKSTDLKKSKKPLKVAVCPECGYVEFYIETQEKEDS